MRRIAALVVVASVALARSAKAQTVNALTDPLYCGTEYADSFDGDFSA